MVAVVGAYLLLRPYLVKLGEKLSNKQYAETAATTQTATGPKAKISPNALRGVVGKEEEEEEEEMGEAKGVDAGKKGKARKRQQKKTTKNQEEGSDAELLDHLVDYVEGEDGW